MFNNLNEIKDFILWCRENKIKTVSYGDLVFEMSDLAFIDSKLIPKTEDILIQSQEDRETEKLLQDDQDKEDEELLYYSADK